MSQSDRTAVTIAHHAFVSQSDRIAVTIEHHAFVSQPDRIAVTIEHHTFVSEPVMLCVCVHRGDSSLAQLLGAWCKSGRHGDRSPAFPGRVYASDSQLGTPVATLPGAWRYRISARTSSSAFDVMAVLNP